MSNKMPYVSEANKKVLKIVKNIFVAFMVIMVIIFGELLIVVLSQVLRTRGMTHYYDFC